MAPRCAAVLLALAGLWQGGLPAEVNGAPGPRMSLTEIFRKHKAKGGHGYHRYYERELAPYRDLPGIRILEIGVCLGMSMRMWLDYFSSIEALHGIIYQSSKWPYADYQIEARKNTSCALHPHLCPLLTFYQLDQSSKTDLQHLITMEPAGWDIIIDDGSHVPMHQLISFKFLFPRLRPGGLYVVEDFETSYVDSGMSYYYPVSGGLGKRSGNAVEKFKDLVDVVMRAHFLHDNFTVLGNEVDGHLVRLGFGDGIIFAEKRPAGPDWYRQRYPPPGRPFTFPRERFERGVLEHQARLAAEEQVP